MRACGLMITVVATVWLATTPILSSAAEHRAVEYKCHFAMAGGKNLVQRVASKAKNATAVMREMAGKAIFAKDGVTKKSIHKVVECVKASDSFKGLASQELDKQSLS